MALKDRLHILKADRDRAKAALERVKEHSVSHIRIDPALIERFGSTMREKFSTGSVPFRKAYLRSLMERHGCRECFDAQQQIGRSNVHGPRNEAVFG